MGSGHCFILDHAIRENDLDNQYFRLLFEQHFLRHNKYQTDVTPATKGSHFSWRCIKLISSQKETTTGNFPTEKHDVVSF